jgi:Leucine-rich repeat (LRR) protein
MNRLGVHMHSFRRLEELQVLVLASNKLVGVHPSVWSLTSLVRLDLGHNNLTELPADVSQLTGLTVSSTQAIAQHYAKHHVA